MKLVLHRETLRVARALDNVVLENVRSGVVAKAFDGGDQSGFQCPAEVVAFKK
jgi:hypothetical protein